MELTFRKATKNDIIQISILVSKLLGTCDIDKKDSSKKSFQSIVEQNIKTISSTINNYYVCADKKEVIGACGLSDILTENTFGLTLEKYRETLYLIVDERYQRKGIGTKLLNLCCQNGDVPIIYEAWGDNGKYVNSKFILEKCNFKLLKDLGNTYYRDSGYCPSCVNRNKKCNSCLAQIWIKNIDT